MSEAQLVKANTSTAVPPQALCNIDGCGEVATHSYVWAWGEAGYCCPKHVAILQQKAAQLKRTITFTALQPGAPSQITRDERTQLIAAKLAAEGETEDVKARNRDLYGANRQLTAEIVRMRTQLQQAESQNQDIAAELEQVTKEKMAALKESADAINEVARLQGILHAREVGAEVPTTREPPGE